MPVERREYLTGGVSSRIDPLRSPAEGARRLDVLQQVVEEQQTRCRDAARFLEGAIDHGVRFEDAREMAGDGVAQPRDGGVAGVRAAQVSPVRRAGVGERAGEYAGGLDGLDRGIDAGVLRPVRRGGCAGCRLACRRRWRPQRRLRSTRLARCGLRRARRVARRGVRGTWRPPRWGVVRGRRGRAPRPTSGRSAREPRRGRRRPGRSARSRTGFVGDAALVAPRQPHVDYDGHLGPPSVDNRVPSPSGGCTMPHRASLTGRPRG